MQPPLSKTEPLARPREVSPHRLWVSVIVLVGLLICAALLFFNRVAVRDWMRLRTYHPTAQMTSLVRDDGLTSYGQHMLYINKPLIEGKTQFAKDCPLGSEQTIVLGCYEGGENGIYVLGVDDPRLHGIEQVTAAHEMLHAAYDRLSSGDKKRVDAMLTDYYTHDLTDPRIKETIKAYKKSEPSQVVNEMHSVFGTEVANLPAPLEQYYQRYFTDRKKITAYAADYQKVFIDRETAIAADNAKLEQLKAQITSITADLTSQRNTITSMRTQMEQEKAASQYTQYNAQVDHYNALVASYRQEAARVESLISEYNQIVKDHNAQVFASQQIVDELQTNVPAASE